MMAFYAILFTLMIIIKIIAAQRTATSPDGNSEANPGESTTQPPVNTEESTTKLPTDAETNPQMTGSTTPEPEDNWPVEPLTPVLVKLCDGNKMLGKQRLFNTMFNIGDDYYVIRDNQFWKFKRQSQDSERLIITQNGAVTSLFIGLSEPIESVVHFEIKCAGELEKDCKIIEELNNLVIVLTKYGKENPKMSIYRVKSNGIRSSIIKSHILKGRINLLNVTDVGRENRTVIGLGYTRYNQMLWKITSGINRITNIYSIPVRAYVLQNSDDWKSRGKVLVYEHVYGPFEWKTQSTSVHFWASWTANSSTTLYMANGGVNSVKNDHYNSPRKLFGCAPLLKPGHTVSRNYTRKDMFHTTDQYGNTHSPDVPDGEGTAEPDAIQEEDSDSLSKLWLLAIVVWVIAIVLFITFISVTVCGVISLLSKKKKKSLKKLVKKSK